MRLTEDRLEALFSALGERAMSQKTRAAIRRVILHGWTLSAASAIEECNRVGVTRAYQRILRMHETMQNAYSPDKGE